MVRSGSRATRKRDRTHDRDTEVKHQAPRQHPKKAIWQKRRANYTWHLHPTDRGKFDNSHWWKARKDIKPEAALYELARRHPLVGQEEKIIEPLPGGEPPIPVPSFLGPRPSLKVTRNLCMKSWAKLTATEQQRWRSSLGKMKGFDFRSDESVCVSITELARSAISMQREETRKASREHGPPYFPYYPPVDPTEAEWEDAIAKRAVEARRKGYLIFGLAPDLAADKAGAILASAYKNQRRTSPPTRPRQRARWDCWLPMIEQFEDDETRRQGAKSQVFARYRRALDGIRFL